MSTDLDLILIGQSEVVNYAGYSKLPLDRLEVYQELVFPRMVRYRDAFHSHLDLLNTIEHGCSYYEATPEQRRRLLSIWNLPSLGAMHLGNWLHGEGFHVCLINNFDSEWDRFCEAYRNNKKPPLVGLSSTFHLDYSELGRITKRLRSLNSKMSIVVGGAFVNAQTNSKPVSHFETPMRKLGIDYIIHSFHAERDLLNLLKAHIGDYELSNVNNLSYFDLDGSFKSTPSQWNPPLLDSQPVCWNQIEAPFINRTVQVRTSCGCPFSCSFCSYPKVARGFQTMEIDCVKSMLDAVVKIPGVQQIVFVDDTLNLPRQRFREICELLSRYSIEWYSFLRVNLIEEEDVKRMKDSGCQAVYLGIESSNDLILKNMNKSATREQFARGIDLLKRYGIVSVAAFVLGFPGETENTILENIKFIEESGVDFFTLKPFYYMNHTGVHEQRHHFGLTGSGPHWAHHTMNSDNAKLHMLSMFREIRGACYIDADTSLWYLVLLRDAGFSFPQIFEMQTTINDLVRRQLDGNFNDNDPSFDYLAKVLSERKS